MRSERWARAAALAFAALSVACVVWGVVSAFERPPNYPEACVLFNAQRLRAGLPLYVDAVVGAHEYGEPPARFWVAYTPIFAWLLARVPVGSALALARLVNLAGWLAALARVVRTAAPRCRSAARLAAAFAASVFVFTYWASSVKPDGIALFLASVACTRSLDRDEADGTSGFLFGAAALVKPSVIGMAVGALGATLVLSRGRHWRGVAVGAATVIGGLSLLQLLSGGEAIGHLRAALGLAFDVRLLAANLVARGPFVVGLVAAAFLAARHARMGFAVLAASVLIAATGYGKLGAGGNYSMEPALASVIVLSRFPLARTGRALAGLLGILGALSIAWSTIATVRSLHDEPFLYGSRRAALRRIRAKCIDRPGAIVVSDDPGIELEVDGRIHAHEVELWNQVRLGRFPSALWVADLENSNVRCVVSFTGDRAPPPTPPGFVPPDVGAALTAFALVTVDEGYAVYERSR